MIGVRRAAAVVMVARACGQELRRKAIRTDLKRQPPAAWHEALRDERM
jgi:hypothetical protein